MPDRPLTIATYAAGASLAAVTLVYVFGPTFFLDDEAAQSSRSSRKVGVVGLANAANDCFINSVLQALAGLPELRAYLIREVHRRSLDSEGYRVLEAWEDEERRNPDRKKVPEWKVLGLQEALVTKGLKEVLDALNERPIWKKTISAGVFIRCVEGALRTRISRTQQDAQEFLQVVLERLGEEWAAGKRVRKWQQRSALPAEGDEAVDEEQSTTATAGEDDDEDDETAFPLRGKLESTLECSHCHFIPKPSISSFLTLTLTVPHHSTSSTLSTCFDGLFKVEHIEDFKCDRCRLDHALQLTSKQLLKTSLSPETRASLESNRVKLETSIANDPENPPEGVELPPLSTAPTRRIARHTRIASFPSILAVHLSRSVWDPSASSSKNLAKVSFPETLPLGGLLDRREYRLLGVVTHKGGHNSGHYESFRRQVLSPPFSTPVGLGRDPKGVYSARASPRDSPRLNAQDSKMNLSDDRGNETTDRRKQTSSPPLDSIPTPGLPSPPRSSPAAKEAKSADRSASVVASMKNAVKRKTGGERWWRISDEKVKECKTQEVLGMQREVYLLFYEKVES